MLDRRDTLEKWPQQSRTWPRGALIFVLGAAAGIGLSSFAPSDIRPSQALAQTPPGATRDLKALSADIDYLMSIRPDQAHAMQDVGQHFSALWFAGESSNWELANFLLGETRSHLRWSVRMLPVRKDSKGKEVDLRALLQSFENTPLKELEASIAAGDVGGFEKSFGATLKACYECHVAVEKPFLRLQIPNSNESEILNSEVPVR